MEDIISLSCKNEISKIKTSEDYEQKIEEVREQMQEEFTELDK